MSLRLDYCKRRFGTCSPNRFIACFKLLIERNNCLKGSPKMENYPSRNLRSMPRNWRNLLALALLVEVVFIQTDRDWRTVWSRLFRSGVRPEPIGILFQLTFEIEGFFVLCRIIAFFAATALDRTVLYHQTTIAQPRRHVKVLAFLQTKVDRRNWVSRNMPISPRNNNRLKHNKRRIGICVMGEKKRCVKPRFSSV